MDQIINELSVTGEYPDRYAANIGMQQLLAVSIEITRIGFSPTIRITRDFRNLDLTASYSVLAWAIEKSTDLTQRDLQRHFLTYATKGLYIEDFIAESEEEDKLIEYKHNLGTPLGLGLADLWDTPVLSLECGGQFRENFVRVLKTSVTEDGDDEQVVEVLNLWRIEQVAQFQSKLEQTTWRSVKDGVDLLNELPQLLPHLRICDNARKQLEKLNGSEQFFPEILRHLLVLNNTMAAYTEGSFEPTEINWSVESTSTLHQFSGCRTFACQDGQKRTFSLHSKILSANKRTYFFPLPAEKIVHIGYVGKHLPTTRHHT